MEHNYRSANKVDFNALYLAAVKTHVTRTGWSCDSCEWRIVIEVLCCLCWHFGLISVVRHLSVCGQSQDSEGECGDKPDSLLLWAAGQPAQPIGLLLVSAAGVWLAGASWEVKECRLTELQHKHWRFRSMQVCCVMPIAKHSVLEPKLAKAVLQR